MATMSAKGEQCQLGPDPETLELIQQLNEKMDEIFNSLV